MEKTAGSIVDMMIRSDLVEENMRDWYIYAMERLTETALGIGTMLLIGAALHKGIPMLVFLVFCMTLRRRTGGFHLNSYLGCYISSTLLSIGAVLWAFYAATAVDFRITMAVTAAAAILILAIGTVNHPNIHFDAEELAASKKRARIAVSVELGIIAAAWLLGVDKLYLSCMSAGIIVCAILLTIAKIIKQEVKANETGNDQEDGA